MESNPRYAELWNLPASLCQPGARFVDLLAANPATELHSPQQLDAEKAPSGTTRRRREWLLRDGRIIAVTITRLADGGCVALHEDITEQRRSEQRVACSSGT